jgi:hypothetical protein
MECNCGGQIIRELLSNFPVLVYCEKCGDEPEKYMIPTQENAMWSLMVHEARRLFYVEIDGKVAEEPGFFVSGLFWEKKNHRYTLYMNGVAEIGSFKSMHEVDEKIKEICKTAKEPLRILEMMKHNKMKVIAECPS